MKNRLSALAYLGLGALLMYVLDPQSGRQRRERAWDWVKGRADEGLGFFETLLLRLSNAARGAAAGFAQEQPSDQVLVQRLRSEIGHIVAHAEDIDVRAHHGHVTLTGLVRPYEVENVLRRTRATKGVRDVENLLEVRPAE